MYGTKSVTVTEAEKMKVFLSYVGYIYGMKRDYEGAQSNLAAKINSLGKGGTYNVAQKPVRKVAYIEPVKMTHWIYWIGSFAIFNFFGIILMALYQFVVKKKIKT